MAEILIAVVLWVFLLKDFCNSNEKFQSKRTEREREQPPAKPKLIKDNRKWIPLCKDLLFMSTVWVDQLKTLFSINRKWFFVYIQGVSNHNDKPWTGDKGNLRRPWTHIYIYFIKVSWFSSYRHFFFVLKLVKIATLP